MVAKYLKKDVRYQFKTTLWNWLGTVISTIPQPQKQISTVTKNRGINFCKNLNDSETLSPLGMDEKDRMLHR